MLLPGLTTRLHGYVLSPWRSTYEASPVRGRERSQSRRSTSPWTVLSAAALTRASRVVRVAMCVLAASAAPALMHELLLRAQHLQAACAMHVLRLRACAPLSHPQHTAHSAQAAHTARTAPSTLSTTQASQQNGAYVHTMHVHVHVYLLVGAAVRAHGKHLDDQLLEKLDDRRVAQVVAPLLQRDRQ